MDQMQARRLLTLRQMLKLEIKGMHRSRPPSAYVILKKEFGLTGTREAVLAQVDAIRNAILAIQE